MISVMSSVESGILYVFGEFVINVLQFVFCLMSFKGLPTCYLVVSKMVSTFRVASGPMKERAPVKDHKKVLLEKLTTYQNLGGH